MGLKSVFSGIEKAKFMTFEDQGLSTRAIAKNLKRSPSVILNYLLLQEDYKTKKSP